MRLPADVPAMILHDLGMPDLDHKTKSKYAQKLRRIRRQMTTLSDDFASSIATENRYSDAYFAYNFPMNLMKTTIMVQQIRAWYAGLFTNKQSYSVLDIGCGEGAGLFGFYYGFRDHEYIRSFNFVGIDGSRKMLWRAKALSKWLRKSDKRLKARFLNQNIDSAYRCEPKGRYDVILLVNSLAEIIHEEVIPTQFVKAVARCLNDDGLVVIIEPALKRLSRRIMALRDSLTKHKALRVLLPCLHDNECAMLQVKGRNEWCHQSISWSPPDFLKIINQGLNREIDILKFAYLVIVKNGARLIKPQGHMVVSQLFREKGRKRCFLCTPDGRIELVRLNRAKSSFNDCFDKIKKGSIIDVKNVAIKKPYYWLVQKETTVHVLE